MNLATRDAIESIATDLSAQQTTLDNLAARADAIPVEQLRADIDSLREHSKNMVAGLNQRLYGSTGQLHTQLTDLRLQQSQDAEKTITTESRVDALEERVAELASQARDVRLRHAQLDTFLDHGRADNTPTEYSPHADIDDRNSYLELALAHLLDGPSEHLRTDREQYLPLVRTARESSEAPVIDLAPARGEWLEVLGSTGIPAYAASTNRLVREYCARLGVQVAAREPLELLAECAPRTVGAVTAFRFAERQDPATVARLFDLAALALRKGGVLILETVTPDRERRQSDPLARTPLSRDFLCFLAEASGFASIDPDAGPTSLLNDRDTFVAWR